MEKLREAVNGVCGVLDFTAELGFESEEVEFCREVSYALYWICRNIEPIGGAKIPENREHALQAAMRALNAIIAACKAYEKNIFRYRIEGIREGMRCMEVFHKAKADYLKFIRDHSGKEASTSKSETSHS